MSESTDDDYGIHWFRRDLRLNGNPAWIWSCKRHQGKVLGLFCFDKKFLARPDFSIHRFQFFLNTLAKLKEDLLAVGSDLLVLDVGPEVAFQDLFREIRSKGLTLPKTFSWNRDYEPFARARDEKVSALVGEFGVEAHDERDHVLIEPHEVLKDEPEKEPYKVYTPYSRKWLKTLSRNEIFQRIKAQSRANNLQVAGKKFGWEKIFSSKMEVEDVLEKYLKSNAKLVTIEIPKAGVVAAWEKLKKFNKVLKNYRVDRDFPAKDATSKMSIFLKNGSITTAQIIGFLKLRGNEKFFSELIWREFYYYVLFHKPEVERSPFQEKFQNIQWRNNEKWFAAWQEGQTGYPLVDAGMRQLKATGWMHNRVRMVVASFLCKDLLCDWRWGEKHFMQLLLDGDLAPNNGGWQWAASTGCDAQPYFRIFNPTLQSEKFDPEGEYIKKFVPELQSLGKKEIHFPHADIRKTVGYPKPIVDHALQKQLALKMYKL